MRKADLRRPPPQAAGRSTHPHPCSEGAQGSPLATAVVGRVLEFVPVLELGLRLVLVLMSIWLGKANSSSFDRLRCGSWREFWLYPCAMTRLPINRPDVLALRPEIFVAGPCGQMQTCKREQVECDPQNHLFVCRGTSLAFFIPCPTSWHKSSRQTTSPLTRN